MSRGDTGHAEANLDSFEFKKLKKIKADEPLEGDEVKIVGLSDMLPLEGDEEKLKIYQLLESNEKVKQVKRLKIFAPNKLLNRIPVLLGPIQPGNNSY